MDTKITDMEAALGEDRINALTICYILTAAALILVLSAITPISIIEIVLNVHLSVILASMEWNV